MNKRIMKAGNGKHFEQAYNAPAVVDTESMLIVGKTVTNAPNDKEQLLPTLTSIPVQCEWDLVALNYNIKHLFNLK